MGQLQAVNMVSQPKYWANLLLKKKLGQPAVTFALGAEAGRGHLEHVARDLAKLALPRPRPKGSGGREQTPRMLVILV
jgi:hypothetical protein